MLYDDMQILTHLQSILDLSLCLERTLLTAGFLQCLQALADTVLQQSSSQEPQLLYGSYSENKSKMSTQFFFQALLKPFVAASQMG